MNHSDIVKESVTVVPVDDLIIVDGEALQFAFTPLDERTHAIEWIGTPEDGKGVLQWVEDGKMYNENFAGIEHFETEVAPYVDFWTAEKARLEEEASKPLSPEEQQAALQAELTGAVQSYLDNFAKTRLYDDIHSACGYYNDPDPVFAEEAAYCVRMRSEVWKAGYAIMNDVLQGKRGIPTVEELLAELPKLEWPTERPAGM